ncbi:MAG: hypothetical protein KIT70_06975 [Anaerolineales bacterium]|nr:MAG: hypothetical protein KIT70_06975 [Anaerolineales bacterium]
MRTLMAVLLLLGATLLQITLLPRIRMLQGSVDLVLLIMLTWMLQEENRPDWRLGLVAGVMMGYASALPDLVLIAGYTLAALVCQLLHRRVWQVRMLTMLTSLILGTLVIHIITLGYLWLSDNPISAGDAFNLITLPTMLLNLILLLPVNALITEFNKLISSPANP